MTDVRRQTTDDRLSVILPSIFALMQCRLSFVLFPLTFNPIPYTFYLIPFCVSSRRVTSNE